MAAIHCYFEMEGQKGRPAIILRLTNIPYTSRKERALVQHKDGIGYKEAAHHQDFLISYSILILSCKLWDSNGSFFHPLHFKMFTLQRTSIALLK